MLSEPITKEMHNFEASVKQLSDKIGHSVLWQDKKYVELATSVAEIAKQSKDVFVVADKCCKSIKSFEKILSEKI